VPQPLTELRLQRSRQLRRALPLADPPTGAVSDEHARLGVAAEAPVERP